MIKQGIMSEITILICDAPSEGNFFHVQKSIFEFYILDIKPEVIYEAYKFSIKDSCKPLDQSKTESPDALTRSGRQGSSTILLNGSRKNAVQLKRSKADEQRSKIKERNIQMQNMIAEVFEKMNEFAQKRDVSKMLLIENTTVLWFL